MPEINTSIIPVKQKFATLKNEPKVIDLEAICVYVATGFFLDDDTFWKHKKVLRPGTKNILDSDGNLVSSSQHFKWHYKPDESLSFSDAVENFGALFEKIIDRQVGDQRVILPLSGGLDSRTQAVTLHKLNKNVSSYCYAFKGGYPEAKIGKSIAKTCNFDFKAFTIQPNYLWSKIDDLAKISECYSEFSHPRQMAIIDAYKTMGDVFSLGHWGDVLFDDMGVSDNLGRNDQVDILLKKIVKPSGIALAEKLWKHFNLDGKFKDYFTARIYKLYKNIHIESSANASIRAFKSTYWAPRWTSINLNIFSEVKPITLPYYDDEMCKFICQIPESYLAQRAIQIAYIKRRAPELAKIVWHQQKPFNLNTYQYNKTPFNLPYRVYSKLNRMSKDFIGKPLVQRNWELQFIGESNEAMLRDYLFKNSFIPKDIISEVFNDFKTKDKVYHAHAVSMFLTLSLWDKHFNNE
ncbi:asparagine synthetase B family protein [Winogradskyella eckloniae]|uniref:asparagine synthase-related protein n=1 Tax=Winogradskyella eckloniae TaxID=1089306 RepID=UPI001566742E|nr:asparagine synthase-related protein [Winogradskyella eckloniae]NRD20552.1 asparagine synthetase B family protein [Winogradskyella eckloniae]